MCAFDANFSLKTGRLIFLIVALAAVDAALAAPAPIKPTIQQHLDAVVVVQRSAKFLYDLGYSPHVAGLHCAEFRGVPVRNPDSSTIQFVRLEDCTEIEYLVYNGASSAEIFYPDRTRESIRRVNGVLGAVTEHVLSRGDVSRYTVIPRTSPADPLPEVTEGEIVLANGARANFRIGRFILTYEEHDVDLIDVILPNGNRLHWEVPVTDSDHAPAGRPILEDSAPGYYIAGKRRIDFALVQRRAQGPEATDTSGAYNRWKLRGPGGLLGAFGLAPDFSGAGQSTIGGKLFFVGSWDQHAHAIVTLGSGASITADPSAGAIAFGNAAFNKAIIDNAPQPGVLSARQGVTAGKRTMSSVWAGWRQ
jgi:hypothetical protein